MVGETIGTAPGRGPLFSRCHFSSLTERVLPGEPLEAREVAVRRALGWRRRGSPTLDLLEEIADVVVAASSAQTERSSLHLEPGAWPRDGFFAFKASRNTSFTTVLRLAGLATTLAEADPDVVIERQSRSNIMTLFVGHHDVNAPSPRPPSVAAARSQSRSSSWFIWSAISVRARMTPSTAAAYRSCSAWSRS